MRPSHIIEKSREEIEQLKTNWLADPCWDIEDTEGFEAHHDELLIFRLTTDRDYYRYEYNKLRNALAVLKSVFA